MAVTSGSQIEQLLGDEAQELLTYQAHGIDKGQLHLPGPDFIDRVWWTPTGRCPCCATWGSCSTPAAWAAPATCRSCPSTRASSIRRRRRSRRTPPTSTRSNIVELAIEGGCNAVASTFGVLGAVARRYAHRIPFIVKLNHNELLTYPNKFDQIMFGSVRAGLRPGRRRRRRHHLLRLRASRRRQIRRSARPSTRPTSSGMFTVLWCYLRNSAFKTDGGDYAPGGRPHRPGQPPRRHHRGRHHQAEAARSRTAATLALQGLRQDRPAGLRQAHHRQPDRPDPLAGGRTATWAACRLINSGGESAGDADLAEAVRTAVINKRAGGTGLIVGRKAFQRPMAEGVAPAERHPGRLPGRVGHAGLEMIDSTSPRA